MRIFPFNWRVWSRLVTVAAICLSASAATASGPVIITEFLAKNSTGQKDEDGAYSDWIELFNTTTNTVNLGGWFLTDTEGNLTQWRLPSTNLPPNSFLVVFASGKDRAMAGLPLHANFSLATKGEYLGLIEPDGVTVSSEFKASFPEQFPDISYGLGQEVQVTAFVSNKSPARVYVPTNSLLGTTWTGTNFNDASWLNGTNGVGFEAFVPGFSVRNIRANIGVCDLATAEQVLSDSSKQSAVFRDNPSVINYVNTGEGAHFLGDTTFPGFTMGVDENNFVTEATGVITIPTSGWWTFGVNSDDGFSVTIGTNAFSYPPPRGPGDTFAAFNLAAGMYPLRLVFYECGGGSEVEFFAAPGNLSAFTSGFALVGDTNGLAVKCLPTGSVSGASLRPLIARDIEQQMAGKASSAYVRMPFALTNPAAISSLTLRVKYNDGFCAYLNGTEIARRNVIGTARSSWTATPRAASAALDYEDIDVSAWISLLKAGTNILAVQGVNESTNGGQFVIEAELAQIKLLNLANHYFAKPTPGTYNTLDYVAFVGDLNFNPSRGCFQNTNFSVTITTATPGVVIYYTTNGSTPSATNGLLYSGPIPVKGTTILKAIGVADEFAPSAVEAHSYIFLNQVQLQSTNYGYVGGSAGNYTLDPAVTQGPYRDVFINSLTSVPTLSVSLANDDFFGPNGIWSNPQGKGAAWERACSAEYMRPDGKKGFHVNCGLRVQGGVSRVGIPKHSLRLAFKDEFGPGKLDYDLYPGSPVQSFDALSLHASFNDHWLWAGTAAVLHRDQFCRDTQNEMGGHAAHGTYAHLYINGIYWGLYNIGETSDDSFAASYLGGAKDDYDAFTADQVLSGDGNAFNTLLALADAGVTNDVAYTTISQYLDIPEFINYMLMNFYAANTDWPYHNWTAARHREAGAGLQFFSWDAEWVLGIGNDPGTDRTGLDASAGTPARIYAGLRKHPEFNRLFGDIAQRNCFNRGVLTPDATAARWARRSTEIDQAIIAETARWGGGNTRDTWLAAEAGVRTWFQQRTGTLVAQLRNAGLYPKLDAPAMAPFGGTVAPGALVSVSNSNAGGIVYYTADGSDPRMWGGATNTSATAYKSAMKLTNAVFIRARVFDGTNWSALVENMFYVAQDFSKLALTEIMYNPPSFALTNGDQFEFIELKNTGTNMLDLSGVQFTSGISFIFTNGTRLAAGQYFVLVRDPVAFAMKYPGVAISGVYTGKLSNGGDRLTLASAMGETIFSFNYQDAISLPQTADGLGFSLVRTDPAADPDLASSWRASGKAGGSPGAADPIAGIPNVLINEVLTHVAAPQVDAIELYNPTGSNAVIGGWYLSDDGSNPYKFRIPAGKTIPAHGYVTFTAAEFNAAPGSATNFGLKADGDSLYLFSVSANNGNLTGYCHGTQFGAAAMGVSFGRYVVSTSEEFWPAQSANTLGTNNAGPLIGPVVINEVLYKPAPGADEFVELCNITSEPVPLYDVDYATNGWRLKGVDYTITNGTILPPGGYLLLVGCAPDVFRAKYGIGTDVPVLGPYSGSLQGGGERLRLEKPGTPTSNGVPYTVVDEVKYANAAPWPAGANGDGPSIQRRHPSDYGNEPTNWFASGITPGAANRINQAPICNWLMPQNGSSYVSPATVQLQVLALDPDGNIAQIDFYDGTTWIGSVTNAPYSFAWTNAGLGTHALTAKARDTGYAIGITAPLTIVMNAPPMGAGTGLQGDYYDNIDFTGLHLKRLDPVVFFDWGTGSPDPSLGVDSFSARWTGKVQPRSTGTYTFYTVSDDGVRLWVDNQPVIDNWGDHAPTENSGMIALQAGRLYDIKMEFYENGGGAAAQMLWSGPDVTKQVIPSNQLYAPSLQNQAPTVSLTSPLAGAQLITGSEIQIAASGYDPDGSVARVDFYAGTAWVGSMTQSPYVVSWTNSGAGSVQLVAVATDNLGLSRTSMPVNVTISAGVRTNIVLVGAGSAWDYNDTGASLDPVWPTVSFNAFGWSNGLALLGYGGNGERTVISYGPSSTNKHITTYFRRTFSVDMPGAYDSLNLEFRTEDGIAVYLNGSMFYRNNMPDGPFGSGTCASTNAVGSDATNFHSVMINAGYLIPGMNVLAAEVHLASPTAPSLEFDAHLTGARSYVAPTITVQPLSAIVEAGGNVQLNVGADGSAPMSFLWLRDEHVVSEAGPVLDLSSVQPEQAGSYRVVVANAGGAVTSAVAVLTVSLVDSDGDGMPDYWEQAHGLDPRVNDAGLDPDHDGVTNLQEYLAGTDPQNPASALKLNGKLGADGMITIEFPSVADRSYSVQTWSGAQGEGWAGITNFPAEGTNGLKSFQIRPGGKIQFYRVATPAR